MVTVAETARAAISRPGALTALAILSIFLSIALSVDFPRAAFGFKGDEATYYSLAHSIARDGDFTYRRADLVRVWKEYTAPEGIFLKRGSRIDFQRSSAFPFVRMVQTPDTAADRLYYGKAYIYPLFAAPFVRVFGTSGFLIFHALMLALNFAAAYRFLVARGSVPVSAAAFAAVFIFGSVVPIYFFWLTPELFNVTLVLNAYFLWSYKLVAGGPGADTRLERFLRSRGSDLGAAVLLGIATFSKPTHVVLMLPVLGLPLLQKRFEHVIRTGIWFAGVVVLLFGVNAASSGEFNYQGGERKSFYSGTGFPFANTWETFDNRSQLVATDAVPGDILFHRDTATVLAWNLMYFSIGRYSGLLPYFFPGVLAVMLFLIGRSHRQGWQWLVAATLAAGAIGLLCYMPYTYSGGGGPIGNRYFLSFYPLFLFLLPPLRQNWPALVALGIGALFTAKLTLNPLYASFNPGEHAKAGPLRVLPIERTLLNDLPVSADPDRSRRSLAGAPRISAYFPDDGAYMPEGDSFWSKGGRRADVILRAPTAQTADGRIVPLRVRAWTLEITNSGVSNRVVVSSGADRQRFDLAPGEVRTIQLAPGAGVPYKPARFPTNFVYTLSVSTTRGWVPFLETTDSSDSRYLGVFVRVTPIYYNP